MTVDNRRAAIDAAIKLAGGIQPFCSAMGVTHQAVYSWAKKGYVPAKRAVDMERLGFAIVADVVDPAVAAAFASMNRA